MNDSELNIQTEEDLQRYLRKTVNKYSKRKNDAKIHEDIEYIRDEICKGKKYVTKKWFLAWLTYTVALLGAYHEFISFLDK